MQRRRYLVLASTVLLAGCQSDGDEVSPTATPTEADTDTATATETPTETATATETETETETATETQAEPTSWGALGEARSDTVRAHELYLEQGGDATSILEIGPETSGFDDEPIREALSDSFAHLEQAATDDDDDLQQAIEELRTANRWLRAAARMQAGMSRTTDEVAAAGTAAEDRAALGSIADRLTVARDAARTVEGLKPDLDRPGPRPFMQVDGLDRDTVSKKHDQLQKEAVGFGTFAGILDRTITQIGRMQEARTLIAEDDPGDAERVADRADRGLSDARSSIRNVNVDSFAPVAEIYVATVDELRVIVEEIIEAARDA